MHRRYLLGLRAIFFPDVRPDCVDRIDLFVALRPNGVGRIDLKNLLESASNTVAMLWIGFVASARSILPVWNTTGQRLCTCWRSSTLTDSCLMVQYSMHANWYCAVSPHNQGPLAIGRPDTL